LASGVSFAIAIILAGQQAESLPLQSEAVEEEAPQPSRAELVIKALAEGFPKRIEKIEIRNDDWALLMDDVWYYYAGGKMLPESLLEEADGYSGFDGIYNYQSELPPWVEPTSEQSERFRNRGRSRNDSNRGSSETPAVPRQRSNHFREALWQASSRADSSLRVKSVDFLGMKTEVHSDIVEILSYVEARIMAVAEIDPLVQEWVTGIGELHGWNWRNVAGSQARSNHSYGIAIDILPKSLDGKETYWQWVSRSGRDWWNIPYTDRYHPPDAAIKAFEAYGFIWGGKWFLFDTMHFEYRPEVFIMNGLALEKI
jgi:hypothetical protein